MNFKPSAKIKKHQAKGESEADIKAAEQMTKMLDELIVDNDTAEIEEGDFNTFLARLIFCFFAEDTGLFEKDLFCKVLLENTQEDGSDLGEFFQELFQALNTESRKEFHSYFEKFPYVNGGLFKDQIKIPKFSKKTRKIIYESASNLEWSEINPDIFGLMMQAVVRTDKRSKLGMHYTSVENIHKVIDPLFLDDLRDDMLKYADKPKKLWELLGRIGNIKIFDPACGSGNFLIIAYKELRKLEDEIYEILGQIPSSSRVSLSNFYGIEIDAFAAQTAKLSLWIAYHQMNAKSNDLLNTSMQSLPLKDSGNIVCANACRIDWEKVCPKSKNDEIYILGNPPYLGSRNQKEIHKKDIDLILSKIGNGYKKLDYIACWFLKSIEIILKYDASSAFVSTNSICQGEQVPIFWRYIFDNYKICIHFAHQSFKWINNAKNNAGVTCVIIGLSKPITRNKILFKNNLSSEVRNINPYLIPSSSNFFMKKCLKPISTCHKDMIYGSAPRENGHLILTKEEYDQVINDTPCLSRYLKKVTGSQELLQNIRRYCLWIEDNDAEVASNISFIKKRLSSVEKYRLTSSMKATVKLAQYPHRFTYRTYKQKPSLVIPVVFSERRHYLVSDFYSKDTVVLNSAQVIYDPPIYIFGIISSRMHMVWVKTVAGRLGNSIRYSSELCYNAFPFPDIDDELKEAIERNSYNVLDEREAHPEKTLAELYDPDKMPPGLRRAHEDLDEVIDRCYRSRPFNSDEERLEHLFILYEKMSIV